MSLILHCGARQATREEIDAVPIPKATRSYQPIGHGALSDMLIEAGERYLSDYSHYQTQYGLGRNGNQLFGIHTYRNGSTEIGLSIGFRNSYNKTIPASIALGGSCIVCDNLLLTGDIIVSRKHSRFVERDLPEMITSAVLRARSAYRKILVDAEQMRDIPVGDEEAYRLIGLLLGLATISLRQAGVMLREWRKPSHSEFQPRTLWSLFNAGTEALKTSPPTKIMEKHLQLDRIFADQVEGLS